MKVNRLSKVFTPLYVLLTGTLGMVITFTLFFYKYPALSDWVGRKFTERPEFPVWVFLHAILSCIVTIALIPLWGMLWSFFANQIRNETSVEKRKMVLNLVIRGIIWTIIIFSLLSFLTNLSNQYFDPSSYVPVGHDERITFIYIYTVVTALPALLGMMLIHTATKKISLNIDLPNQTKPGLFALRDELLSYRALLQGYLLFLGIILSMISITTSGLRAVFVGLGAEGIENFPVTFAISFGLIFTLLLLLVYVPVHIALTETSRNLRDSLCPMSNIETLKEDMAQRKTLDELLQTNVSLTENLKSGLLTLAPFVTRMCMQTLETREK